MKLRADAAIDYVGQGSTIVHAHVILVLEAFDLGERHTLRHRLMFNVHRVIHPRNGLGCVAHGERIHFRAEANELDYRISFGLVFELAHFSGVKISMTTSKIRKVAITNLAKVEGVTLRARVYLLCQVFHEEVKETRVGVGVKHLDSLAEGVFQKRVKCVPVKKDLSCNFIHVNTKVDKLHTSLACCTPTRKSHLRTAC